VVKESSSSPNKLLAFLTAEEGAGTADLEPYGVMGKYKIYERENNKTQIKIYLQTHSDHQQHHHHQIKTWCVSLQLR
jgi:hypothetical protein